ncbi:MAG: aminotransferase class III-fold pyridoxal phosphate-dependent enzyme, partial [Leptonema sp. (in: bacteria)]
MGWNPDELRCSKGYFPAVPLTAYNAITPLEAESNRRLLQLMKRSTGSGRMDVVMWAASGSEAIQKALWAAMARDKTRPMILATRYGFHGKKGLSCAITGSETDAERDPRVRFIAFPMNECRDVSLRNEPFDPTPYRKELDALWHQFGPRLGCLITEPYLGGGGSYHPPKAYLQTLQQFCREKDLVFILDEVQANFGRTGAMFAFESYGLEPDIVVLGKGLGNGVPVAAAVGKAEIFNVMDYGEASDTWSANPISAAAVLATIDEFESRDVLGAMQEPSRIIERGLVNYWGYNPIAFFAPNPRYAYDKSVMGAINEFKTMVKVLHQAGFEVILDVVYNHTAEGDHTGPTLSFRGIDNLSYYRVYEEKKDLYVDFTGCGNTLN